MLVATPIGNLGDLSPRAIAELGEADLVCCEDTRRTGRLLEHAGVRAHRLQALHGHNEAARVAAVIAELADGRTIVLVSDAGTPLISDPGERLVLAAVSAGIEVTAVPGPMAGVTALVLSGMGTGRWRFEGFLPKKGPVRRDRLAEIAASPVPVICYEAPHRLRAFLRDLEDVAGGARQVAIARELTKLHEEVWRGCLADARTWAEADEPRGELVVVLDGAPEQPRPDDAAVGTAVAALLEAGLDRRSSVRAVEVLLGVPHRVAYAAAVTSNGAAEED